MNLPRLPNAFGRFVCSFALAFGVLAFAFGEWFVAWLDPGRAAKPEALAEIARARGAFAACAVLLVIVGALVFRYAAWFAPRWRTRAVIVALVFTTPIVVLEFGLAPFIDQRATIFMHDADRGWKLIPGATGYWAGQPVRINSRGLRGPERDFTKPAGTARVLFLGDSVTFGYGIADDALTLPARVEERLSRALARPVECLNGGVDGYSTWQELEFLRREGLRYEPDVVVLGFVVNDVEARFRLRRFGGPRDPVQLELTHRRGSTPLVEDSAIFAFARRVRGRLALGPEAQRGAMQSELLDTFDVLHSPDRADVRAAWASTIQDVDALVRTCVERNVPLVIALFPYATQLYSPELDSPRDQLAPYAAAHGVPLVDLKPPLLAAVASGRSSIETLFLDPCHPTAAGHAVAAESITRVLTGGAWFGGK